MKEKKITIKNLELFYVDNEMEGLPIVMIHGNSMNSKMFHQQFHSTALSHYRLLALDFPGHGKSQRSSTPENDYAVSGFIQIIIEFIKTLGLQKVVLFGHSLGGHIAIHILQQLNNVKGVIILGTPPLTMPPNLESAFLPNPSLMHAFKPDLNKTEIHQLASAFIPENHDGFKLVQSSITNCDPLVRPFIGKSIRAEITEDESTILKKGKAPVAILHGENETLVNAEYIKNLNLPLWEDQIITLENSTHCAFIENPEQCNQVILRFMDHL